MGRHTISADQLLADARRTIRRYQPEEAHEALADGALLIDLRCDNDREAEGSPPGAIPIALSVLPWRADPDSEHRDDRIADRDATLVLMCNDGFSSSLAAADLKQMGFDRVGDIDGGFRAWAQSGLPVVGA